MLVVYQRFICYTTTWYYMPWTLFMVSNQITFIYLFIYLFTQSVLSIHERLWSIFLQNCFSLSLCQVNCLFIESVFSPSNHFFIHPISFYPVSYLFIISFRSILSVFCTLSICSLFCVSFSVIVHKQLNILQCNIQMS